MAGKVRSAPVPVKVAIEPVAVGDIRNLTKKDFYFSWKEYTETELWKLQLVDSAEILGVMSLTYHPSEYRIEINLIASHRNNVGTNKQYDRIAGCLIGWACRLAVKQYGFRACVSLTPKTKLIEHYRNHYNMLNGGQQLYVEDASLYSLVQTYIDHEP